ncbi:MAG: hypothetical protein FWH26_09505 [Oscillospiraceae bacterium]|nr:hypothetical protein [Oscillospiraceae bacterium]
MDPTSNCQKICICSIYEREDNFKDYRFVAAKVAERLGYQPIRNPEEPGMTQLDFENILKNESPFFILLVGDVPSDAVLRECRIAIENGLNIITMLKKNAGTLSAKTKKIMNAISSTVFNADCACFDSCEMLDKALEARIMSLHNKIMKNKIVINQNKNMVYDKAKEMITRARRRIILCQETSSLILGPRAGNFAEVSFHEELVKWIGGDGKNEREFVHIYNHAKTLDEIKNGNQYDLASSRSTLEGLLTGKTKIAFRKYSSDNSVANVIADNDMLFTFYMDKNRYNVLLPHFMTIHHEVVGIISSAQSIGSNVPNSQITQIY